MKKDMQYEDEMHKPNTRGHLFATLRKLMVANNAPKKMPRASSDHKGTCSSEGLMISLFFFSFVVDGVLCGVSGLTLSTEKIVHIWLLC